MENVVPPQSQPGSIPPEVVQLEGLPSYPSQEDLLEDLLAAQLEMTNIAEGLDERVLIDMAKRVMDEYGIDKDSRSEWERGIETALDYAEQVASEKRYAGELVANVKFPTIATASIQFASRAYGNIIKDREVVKVKVVGEDGDQEKLTRGGRIARFMSWQLLEDVPGWEDELDQLLTSLPVLGCVFKKTYFDASSQRVCSDLVSPKDLVVNYDAKTVDDAARLTHVFELTPNEIEERVRAGIFLDIDYDTEDDQDVDAPTTFLEQHRWWDLDEDGYQEPYVVTVHEKTEAVCRITARYSLEGITKNEKDEILKIEPIQYFTRFVFMPSFGQSFYGTGFGSMLAPINGTINSTINQLLDAGTLSNRQSGFIGRGINLGVNQTLALKAGEWKPVNNTGDDLKKGIFPLPVREPSPTLFNLLNLMIEGTDKLSSVTDVMTGQARGKNESPTTVLALIEQSMQVFNTIYKRIYRALKKEYEKIFRLDRMYLQEETYMNVLDDPTATMADFYNGDMDIMPVADEKSLVGAQNLTKAQALLEMMGTGLNDKEIQHRYLQALDIPDIQRIMDAPEPEPDPEFVIEQKKLELESKRIDLDRERVELDKRKTDIKEAETRERMVKYRADATKAMADAEAAEPGDDIAQYAQMLEQMAGRMAEMERMIHEAVGIQRMENAPVDQGVPQAVGFSPEQDQGGLESGGVPGPGIEQQDVIPNQQGSGAMPGY